VAKNFYNIKWNEKKVLKDIIEKKDPIELKNLLKYKILINIYNRKKDSIRLKNLLWYKVLQTINQSL